MMTTLSIKKKNEVYIQISSKEPHVHRELSDYFTFEVPEAKFLKKNPRYKYWDCLLYTSPSPRDNKASRMPSYA